MPGPTRASDVAASAPGRRASTQGPSGAVNTISGAALYLGSLIGPGVLLVPALALRAAGPASIISWGIMILVSAPLALTFAALGVRMPVAGGVAEYVRVGFGELAGLMTGGWFLTAVLVGAPTVAVMGGFYVADLTDGGTAAAGAVALLIFVSVLCGNWIGLRLSARVQLLAASVLTVLIAIAVATALPVEGKQPLVTVCAPRLVGDRHGRQPPGLAVRRMGVGRAARR